MQMHMMMALSLGFAGVLLATGIARAEAQCGPRDTVMSLLADTYGETRRGMGVAANNTVMEVFVSEAKGSWTITVTMPDGTTCLMAAGQGYEAMNDALPAKGQKI